MTKLAHLVLLCAASLLCEAAVISDIEQFKQWATTAYEAGDTVSEDVELKGDLVFDAEATKLVPLGYTSKAKYSGRFNGNGHTIKNLNVGADGSIDYAGLFYGLANATVENLVFDSSCSFVAGVHGGSVCFTVTGNTTLSNVVNNAPVKGKSNVGGLVGESDASLMITNCVNNGNVEATARASCSVGGFVGSIYGTDTIGEIIGSTNNGKVSGVDNAIVGGFFGWCNAPVKVTNSTNNGNIECSGTEIECKAGGVIGSTYKAVTLRSTTNTGSVTVASTAEDQYSGGFVGYIKQGNLETTPVVIENCVNVGAVKSNKEANGITDKLTRATSIVSMGTVSGGTSSHAVWTACSNAPEGVYVLEGVCSTTDDATVFTRNSQDHFYYTSAGARVDEQLNALVEKYSYELKWTTTLRLGDQSLVTVEFGAPASTSIELEAGQALEAFVAKVDVPGVDMNAFHLVSAGTALTQDDVLDKSMSVLHDMSVLLCHKVVLSGEFSGSWYVEHSQKISSNSKLAELLLQSGDSKVWHNKEDGTVIDQNTAVMKDLEVLVSIVTPTQSSSSAPSSTLASSVASSSLGAPSSSLSTSSLHPSSSATSSSLQQPASSSTSSLKPSSTTSTSTSVKSSSSAATSSSANASSSIQETSTSSNPLSSSINSAGAAALSHLLYAAALAAAAMM